MVEAGSRGQNFVNAMATRAVRGQGGTKSRREAVITLEERFDTIRRQVEFGVHALGGVALAANLHRNFMGELSFSPSILCSAWQSVQVGASR